MAQKDLEVADIFRDHGSAWREANRGHVSLDQLKVMSAIERCRSAALGGHVARCQNEACAHTIIAYNSCRNRHCPKCHVWTAPAMQEESDVSANGRVRSCIRPAVAATLAAGHDVIRGSGPNQGVALMKRVTLGGFPQSNGSTVSHHVVFTPAIRERYVYMVYVLVIAKPLTSSISHRCCGDRTYTVNLLLGQHRPSDARNLVGQCDCSNLCRLARQ